MAGRNRIVHVRVGELRIHPEAQRRLVSAQLKKRMADLDLDAIGVLHGVEIDGVVYIVDGQHRIVALQQHGFDDWVVDVMIHKNSTEPRRAHELFLRLNARTSPSAFDTFMNELGAGMPVASGVVKINNKHGVKIDRQARDGHATCVTALKSAFERDNGLTLDEFYRVAIAAWGKRAETFEGKIVDGLCSVLARYNGEMDEVALVKKLAKYPGGPAGLLGDAKGLRRIRGGSVGSCVAETVVETYNRGRRSGRLPVV